MVLSAVPVAVPVVVPAVVPDVRQAVEVEDVLVQLVEVVHSTLVVPLDGLTSAV